MGALCEPIFEVCITCRDCGWVIVESGDTEDVFFIAYGRYKQHINDTHRDDEHGVDLDD